MTERIRSAEVARLTGLSVRAVQDLAARGEIHGAARFGRIWTFDHARIRAWIKMRELWPSEFPKDAIGAATFCGASSPSPAASIADRYEQLIRQKPGADTGPGATR